MEGVPLGGDKTFEATSKRRVRVDKREGPTGEVLIGQETRTDPTDPTSGHRDSVDDPNLEGQDRHIPEDGGTTTTEGKGTKGGCKTTSRKRSWKILFPIFRLRYEKRTSLNLFKIFKNS